MENFNNNNGNGNWSHRNPAPRNNEQYKSMYDEIYERIYDQAFEEGYHHGRRDGYNMGYEHAIQDHQHNEHSALKKHHTDMRWHGKSSKSWSWI
jgi:hypothetical protein